MNLEDVLLENFILKVCLHFADIIVMQSVMLIITLVYFLFVGIYIHCRYCVFYYLHCYTDMDQMVSTRVAIPLYVPDELLIQLKSTE